MSHETAVAGRVSPVAAKARARVASTRRRRRLSMVLSWKLGCLISVERALKAPALTAKARPHEHFHRGGLRMIGAQIERRKMTGAAMEERERG
jgi:hypothetical protein